MGRIPLAAKEKWQSEGEGMLKFPYDLYECINRACFGCGGTIHKEYCKFPGKRKHEEEVTKA